MAGTEPPSSLEALREELRLLSENGDGSDPSDSSEDPVSSDELVRLAQKLTELRSESAFDKARAWDQIAARLHLNDE